MQDFRYAFRSLSRARGVTLAAVLTLALGFGANGAIFSVLYSILIRPLPLRDANQVVILMTRAGAGPLSFAAEADIRDWREQAKSFSHVSFFNSQSVNYTGAEEPARLIGAFVSHEFFSLLNVAPAMGRAFLPGEDEPGAARVAVIGHALWESRFGRDPNIRAKSLVLNGLPYRVVGVLPADFHFPWGDCDVWMPSSSYPNYTRKRGDINAAALARMRPGVGIEQARAEMATVASRIARDYPETNRDRTVALMTLQDFLVDGLRPSLWVLAAVSGFVLLIACANAANLMTARGLARRREIEIRLALGAGRARVVRQLLAESVLLSLAGATLGLIIGAWGADILVAARANELPAGVVARVDARFLAWTFGLSILTGLVFGMAPAAPLWPGMRGEALKSGRGTAGSPASSRTRTALGICQMALALVLLAGAGLMMKSFARLSKVDPGFRPENVLTLEYRLPRARYPTGERQTLFHQEVADRVRALAGVRQASIARSIPFSGNSAGMTFTVAGQSEPGSARYNTLLPGYFETVGIPLLSGRDFTAAEKERVVIINRALARRYWPEGGAVGRTVRLLPGGDQATVVGIVGNVKLDTLSELEAPQMYAPYAQDPFIFATLVVLAKGDAAALAPAVREAVWSVDKDQPVWKVRTLSFMVNGSVDYRRFVTYLLGAFSALALGLAAIGLYGILSYSVVQRTGELGVRIAVGAQPSHILRLVLRQAATLAGLGIAAGAAGAGLLTGFLTTQLYGVSPTDPAVFAATSAVLAAVALAASGLPAWRAIQVDPLAALRHE